MEELFIYIKVQYKRNKKEQFYFFEYTNNYEKIFIERICNCIVKDGINLDIFLTRDKKISDIYNKYWEWNSNYKEWHRKNHEEQVDHGLTSTQRKKDKIMTKRDYLELLQFLL